MVERFHEAEMGLCFPTCVTGTWGTVLLIEMQLSLRSQKGVPKHKRGSQVLVTHTTAEPLNVLLGLNWGDYLPHSFPHYSSCFPPRTLGVSRRRNLPKASCHHTKSQDDDPAHPNSHLASSTRKESRVHCHWAVYKYSTWQMQQAQAPLLNKTI